LAIVVAKRATLTCFRPPKPASSISRLEMAVLPLENLRQSEAAADELGCEIAAIWEKALGHQAVDDSPGLIRAGTVCPMHNWTP
jgi:hypothetical protein